MGNILFTLKIVGSVSVVLLLGSLAAPQIIDKNTSPEFREKVNPYIVSAMTASAIIAPLVWLMILLISGLEDVLTAKDLRSAVSSYIVSTLKELEQSDLGSLANVL